MISYDDHSPHGDDRHGHDHDSHNGDDADDAYKEDEMEGWVRKGKRGSLLLSQSYDDTAAVDDEHEDDDQDDDADDDDDDDACKEDEVEGWVRQGKAGRRK